MDRLNTVVRRGARDGARPDDGQAAVELALVLPAIVLLLLALVQFALVARDELLVVHAAREAARAASVGADGPAAARRIVGGAGVTIEGGAKVGDLVVATVTFHSITDLPLVGALIPDPWLHARVSMRTEHTR